MEVKLATMKLENGTVLEAESFEKDYEVFIVTEDEKVALPVGEYALEDGRILVVVEEGIISEIKEVSGEESPEEEAEMAEETLYVTKEEFSAAIEEIKAMIEKMVEMKVEEPVQENEVQAELSAQPTIEEEVLAETAAAQVEAQLSQEPAAAPLKHSPESNAQRQMFKLSPNRNLSTRDKVLQKISNL
jgi:hypothetical protein